MQDNTDLLPIGEVAIILKRSIHSLRRWDKQGWLKPSAKLWDGSRLYRPDYIHHFRDLLIKGVHPQVASESIYGQYHQEVQESEAEAS
jgi:DNA-binding transcriptional MerR regulator